MGQEKRVLTVAINPAIDQTISIPNFTAGTVNRVQSSRMDAGGKGINVASFLADFGQPATVTGFLGADKDRDAKGAIPFAARDPLRTIPSLMVGSAVAGAMSMAFKCGLHVPHGGIFVLLIPNAVDNLGFYVVSIVAGTLVTTGMLFALKKPLTKSARAAAFGSLRRLSDNGWNWAPVALKPQEVDSVNRHDINLLQAIQGYPALSILLPTHRTSPDNRQDPIRVKNLATEAADRLLREFSKREIQPLLNNLDAIVGEIDYRYALDGLAIFVNKDFARKFYLPFPVKERVIIDESFATRDLVMAMNRSPRYWVLALSEKPTRLFEGAHDTLVEITDYGFPMTHSGPGGETALPGGPGVNKSAYRDERSRQFFRQIDDAFEEVAQDDPLPLLVVGVDRHLSFFDEVTSHGSLLAGTMLGNYDTTTAHDLGKLLWPLVLEKKEARRQELLQELDTAIGAQRSASTLGEAWLQAQMSRVATLLVEKGYHQPARLSESGMLLTVVDEAGDPDVLEDAVDDLIELVLQKGGEAFFFGDGALATHGRVAAILRY